MQGIITQKNLKKGLNVVEKISSKRLSLPILENILIETEESFLKLSSTNLELGVLCWVLAKIKKPGKFLLPGKFLNSFINLLPEDIIEFEVNENKNLSLTCQNHKAEIKGFDVNEFPIIPKYKGVDFIETDNLSFIKNLKEVVNIASDSQIQTTIAGVYIIFDKDSVKFIATDSFRLISRTVFLDKENRKEKSIIVPKKTAIETVSILDNYEGKLRIYVSSNQILFEVLTDNLSQPQIRIISRLIEGEYPDYQEIIPSRHQTRIIVPKDEFIQQIKITSLFCKNNDNINLKIDKKNGIIIFSVTGTDTGQSWSSIKGDIEGEEIELSFSYKFLIDGVLRTEGEKIVFELNGQEQPSVFKSLKDKNYIYLIMPVKV